MQLNEQVRGFWEQEPCGTGDEITHGIAAGTQEWFEQIEAHRYRVEPFIHSVAQFTRWRGRKLLEVGVGAGTDHLQWARAGLDCHGVDLTDAGIETTSKRLQLYGLSSKLQRVDAETLPFPDATFDVVYSWGVIHHSEFPDRIVAQIHRVLKPGGVFIGMVYRRRSVLAVKLWLRHALGKGKPFRSLRDVIWNHMESIGTKAYTDAELRQLLHGFSATELIPLLTTYDTSRLPRMLSAFPPQRWGWFIGFRAVK